jgi:glycine cleavage system H protein
MPDFLETQVDKFIFRVATDRLYSSEGVWLKNQGEFVRIGLSDYLQQHQGDVAFVEIRPAGTQVSPGEEIASIETIKVNLAISIPLDAQVILVNPRMHFEPELINLDPYGEGWLCELKADRWELQSQGLLHPKAYFEQMKSEAEQEAKSL